MKVVHIFQSYDRTSKNALLTDSRLYEINVKKNYQFKTHCKDDVMISLHQNSKNLLGNPRCSYAWGSLWTPHA